MKRILIGFLLISMTFATTACSGSSGKSISPVSASEVVNETATQSYDVALSSEGISITLPKDFTVGKLNLSDNPDITTTFSNTAGTIAIFAIKEFKSEIDVNSVSDYLQLQCENMPEGAISGNLVTDAEGNHVLSEDDGVDYYEYTYFDIGSDSFKYLNTAYESADAFWLVQFCCIEDDYDSNKANFIKWAKTVSFY